jgi:Ni/Co efflux regulator RcnB
VKALLVAIVALSLDAGFAAQAQNQKDQSAVPGKPGIARENETGGGKPLNATSYTYQKGERLSLAHGYFDEIVDWKGHRLAAPAEGDHWVYYGDNYLLARIDTGIIIDIVKASWGAGRG